MNSRTIKQVAIRKDPFNGVSKQWQADLHFHNGETWTSWCANYKTKKSLIDYVKYVIPNAIIVRSTLDVDISGEVV